MNRYEPSTYRPMFGVAAVAMTALTLGMLVVLPTKTGPDRFGFVGPVAATANAAAPTEVVISPGSKSSVSANRRRRSIRPDRSRRSGSRPADPNCPNCQS